MKRLVTAEEVENSCAYSRKKIRKEIVEQGKNKFTNNTCGESIKSGAAISASSSFSGKTGLSFSTVVSIFTVDTVTKSKKAVSTREHLFTG